MAVLNNLIVNGASRLLNKSYINDADIGTLNVSGTFTTDGNMSVGGAMYLGAKTSSNAKLYMNGKLAINGVDTWLRINEGKPFTAGIYTGSSVIRTDGSVQIGNNGTYINATNSALTVNVPSTFSKAVTVNSTLSATTGTIDTLTASNANVLNTLRATKFDLQVAQTVDGLLYIAPTVRFPNSNSIITVTQNTSDTTFAIKDDGITSTTIAGAVWAANGKIKLSGTIGGVVTGTLDGTVVSINTSSHVLTVKIPTNEVAQSITAGTYSASQFENVAVMLYHTGTYPIGILINCYDTSNSSSTIRVYGGSSNNPNVMIGNLTNAGLTAVQNTDPSGWGMYTDNGFFQGMIVSSAGKIGDFTLSNAIYSGTNSISSTTAGVYLGTDGIRNYKDTNANVTIKDGVITARGVDLSGKITATSGSISGSLVTSGIDAGNITAGTISADRIGANSITIGKLGTDAQTAITTAQDTAEEALDAATPIATKTYSGLIGSANDAANASFYFAKIHPTSYAVQWKVQLRISVTAPEAYSQSVDIQLGGYGSSFSSYDSYTVRNSLLGICYINLYRATQAGISTNKKGHALGVGLRSSTNPTTASAARTIKVELLSTENCTVDMLDTAVKYAALDGTGSTNYSGLTEVYVAPAGQNATNNTNTHYTVFSGAVKAGSFGVKRYTLLMKDTDTTWVSFVNQANSIATTKTVSTQGHILGKVIYSCGGTEYASGVNTSTVYDVCSVDLRYSTNCGTTLTAYRPVYLVGTIGSDGLFYLDQSQWWTQTIPTTEDGKTYIYIGEAYSSYQIYLATDNLAYQYYQGEFMTLEQIETAKAQASADSATTLANGKNSVTYSTSAPGSASGIKGDIWYVTATNAKDNSMYIHNGTSWVQHQSGTVEIADGAVVADKLAANSVTANKISVSELSSLSATIGGFAIDTTSIHTKNVAVTSNADNSIALSSADFTRTINSTSRAGLRFAIGDKFGVTGDGAIYASSATIKGALTATSLSTGNRTSASTGTAGIYIDSNGAIYSGADNTFTVTKDGVMTATGAEIQGAIVASSLSTGSKQSTAGASGIYIDSGGNLSAGTNNQVLINADGTFNFGNGGMTYDGSSLALSNGIRIGATDKVYATVTEDSFDLYHNETIMLHFGYGEATTGTGVENSPYYTLGTRYSSGGMGAYSIVEGVDNVASGYVSHAEGEGSSATSYGAHAEGCSTASSYMSHAEGDTSTASGFASHAEGAGSVASGNWSHAEGEWCQASGEGAHAQNYNTVAASSFQTAIGRFNKEDNSGAYAFIIGNGSDSNRSNALTVAWDGTIRHGENQFKVPQIWCGTTAIVSAPANGYKDVAVTLSKEFSGTPTVTCSLNGNSTNGKYGLLSVSVVRNSITTSGFTLRLYNGDSSAHDDYISWIAMY